MLPPGRQSSPSVGGSTDNPIGPTRVLIVDGDRAYTDRLVTAFGAAGARAAVAPDPVAARRQFLEDQPEVVVVDLNVGAWSGFDALRDLRELSAVPIVVLTSADRGVDRARALRMGADECLVKPFDQRELVARVLRRVGHRGTSIDRLPDQPLRIVAGGLDLDAAIHTVTRRGHPVNLTVTEFRLLERLMANAGRVVPTTVLLREVWDQGDRQDPDVLRVTLHRLRRKLGDPAGQPELIQTVPGVGILFKALPEGSPPATEAATPTSLRTADGRSQTTATSPRVAGSVELAGADRLRLKSVTDSDLEADLFIVPGTVLESFDVDRLAATWLVPAVPGVTELVERARARGLAIGDGVADLLNAVPQSLEEAPLRPAQSFAQTTPRLEPTSTAEAAVAVSATPIDAGVPPVVTTSSAPALAAPTQRARAKRPARRTSPIPDAGPRLAPGPRLGMLTTLSPAARWTVVLLGVSAAVASLSILVQFAELELLARAITGQPVSAGELATNGSRQLAIAVALLAAYGATAVTFLTWFHGCYVRLRRAGVQTRRSPRWAVLSFFVPIVNLIVPYQAMTEIWQAGARVGDPPRSRILLDLWWAAWLAFLAASLATSVGADRPTAAQLAGQARLNVIADLAAVVAALVSIAVTVQIERSFQEGGPPIPVPT